MMSEKFWIQIAAYLVGLVLAIIVLMNPKTKEAGIGNQTRQALGICVLAPILLSLALNSIISSETTAALVGAIVGFAAPKGSQ